MRPIQLVVLGVFLPFALYCVAANDDFELIMVAEFFRHGAREPMKNIFNNNWTYNTGELTEVGLRQHYIEGWELRQRYKDFLPQTYNYTLIHTQSTNSNRTLMSAMAHNLGLFDLETGPKMPKDYPHQRAVPPFANLSADPMKVGDFAIPNGYQPVPVHTIDGMDDYILNADSSCPRLKADESELVKTDWFKMVDKLFTPYYEQWKTIFGLNKTLSFSNAYSVYDAFYADWFQGHKTAVDIDDPMIANFTMNYQLILGYANLRDATAVKLANQPTFEKLFEVIDHRIKPNASNMKWFTYSAHEDNILAFQMAFNLTSLDCQVKKMSTGYNGTCLETPPYASLILFEIYKHKKSGETHLKFIMDDKSDYDWCPESAKRTNAVGFCEYNALKEHLKKEFFCGELERSMRDCSTTETERE